eukprot:266391-Amorphochlora_amoeboformis.AAC.1
MSWDSGRYPDDPGGAGLVSFCGLFVSDWDISFGIGRFIIYPGGKSSEFEDVLKKQVVNIKREGCESDEERKLPRESREIDTWYTVNIFVYPANILPINTGFYPLSHTTENTTLESHPP